MTFLSNRFRVIHTIASLKRNAGGPSRTVPALCEGLGGAQGVSVEIVTQDYRLSNDINMVPQPDLVHMTLVPAVRVPYIRVVYTPSFKTTLVNLCKQLGIQLIHDHGMWLPTNHVAATVARRLDLPLIISPLGMLEPWALSYRGWKKRLAWYLYQKRDSQYARVFCVNSEQEAENLRIIGLRQPIAVIPNGIDLPQWHKHVKTQTGLRTALFLSRIHPIKGLLTLVSAWQRERPNGWHVVIAGPDEGGHQKEVRVAIQRAGLQEVLQLVGPVEGDAKFNLYRSADLFVLPTYSENFGVVVAEALACGVPVITTKGAPWEGILTHRCGWWVDIGVEPLAEAIREATTISDEERYDMGQRGRDYVEQNFAWPKIAEQILSVYEWVLNGGTPPGCVMLD